MTWVREERREDRALTMRTQHCTRTAARAERNACMAHKVGGGEGSAIRHRERGLVDASVSSASAVAAAVHAPLSPFPILPIILHYISYPRPLVQSNPHLCVFAGLLASCPGLEGEGEGLGGGVGAAGQKGPATALDQDGRTGPSEGLGRRRGRGGSAICCLEGLQQKGWGQAGYRGRSSSGSSNSVMVY